MERLAEQIVAWHNRHPLARRIAVGDVHTVGVVALPFVRASAEAGGLVEPVLTDAVTFDELAAAPRPSTLALLWRRWRGLLRLPGRKPRTQWRAFSEKFLPGTRLARVERFALAHGFAEAPAAPEAAPSRVVVVDERLAAAHSGWPFEIYLMTAGVDLGSHRTRVLAGRGIPSEILGRRLWDPRRLGAAAALLVLLALAGTWMLWPRRVAEALPAPAPAASMPVPASAAVPEMPVPPASEAASVPSTEPEPAASEPDAAASPPDIRPRLVERAEGAKRPPLHAARPAAVPVARAPAPPTPAASLPPPTDPRLAGMAKSPGQFVVALVGPPGNKAEAEALLKKMQAGLTAVYGSPQSLQSDIVQTPEGWRATVWPFPSREEAQLINATLVARGLRTKAVNF
ncbi:hypothetical protein [Roseateles sp.]|uniref:hypothetical protein n=1 Tax=Roseateles sp. TaxID=1971397 RepID=UPI0025FA5315|nr:hypothetical protein [Roseateles sp.]MBV8036358.1 hypothetical protein [Roseateles sp.]